MAHFSTMKEMLDNTNILSKSQDEIPDLIKCMIDNFLEKNCSLSEIEGKIENEGKMAKNPKVQLTENGVLNLYKKSHKQIFNMQVIFLARTDTNWYLRLSDGKYISPIIRLYKKESNDSFSVGAVLSIKEVVIRSNDLDDPHDLEDPQESRVLIKDYNVLEHHTSFSSILGKLKPDFTYRDSIRLISDLLIKIDPKWENYFKQETKRYERLKEDGERLRERGNALSKKKTFDLAITHFDMAKQKDPYDFRVWSNSSHAYFSSGEFKKAEDEAVRAIKLNPFSEKAYHLAGKAAVKQSDKDAALEYARCGLLICGGDRDLQKLLEECADDQNISDTTNLPSFNTDEGSEKLMKDADKEKYGKDTEGVNTTPIIETTLLDQDESIKELLYDDDITSKCSWERIRTKADVVSQLNDANKADDNDIPPLMDSDKNDNCSSTDGLATFPISIADIGNLNNKTYSQTCYVRNTPWKITFIPRLDNKYSFVMCAFLECIRDTDSTGWSCNVSAQLMLLSVVKRSKSIMFSKVDKKISDKEIKMAIVGYMDWKEVINPENGYIKDGTITVEVHLNARFRVTSNKASIKEDEPIFEEELCTLPKDPYHRIIYEGKKNYEEGQYLQALDLFGKPVPLTSSIEPNDLKLDGMVIQFVSGICKIQSGKGYILDGMDTMKSLADVNSTFSSVPAAHYWLGIGFERLFLLKLAHHHGLLCRDFLKSSKYKGISWPGSEDFISETIPDKLANLVKELLGRIASTRPMPKARCRFINCIATQNVPYAKEEIYISDPDFKGYLNLACEECCIISYHPCCWKAYKESHEESHGKMIDKDFLDQSCKTPDCCGKICSLHIYDETGCLKNTIQKERVKKEIKGLSIIAKQKKKKEKKEKRATKNDFKNKKFESQNEANKENRDAKENIKEESISKKESIGQNLETEQQEMQKAPAIIPTRVSPLHIPQSVAPIIPEKEKSPPTPTLPIDPESLATEKVMILLPPKEDDFILATTNKKNKKKKKNKQNNSTNQQQTDHVLDPMEAEKAQRNEYLARLRSLRQQRELSDVSRLKNLYSINNNVSHLSNSQYEQVIQWLDPETPFYLPQHLRDNPQELERTLQTKIATTSGPDISQETIITLLNFMYDWLKEQGPISINDTRIREYILENFPPEGKNHINLYGSIKEFLMQSIDFALIDDLICVRDHVVEAQEMSLKTIHERMMSSRYLLSDGKKSRKLDNFVDEDFKSPEDVMSTCSSSSSSVHVIGSTVSSNSCNNSSVSKSTNPSEALETRKLSTPVLELDSNANLAKEISIPVSDINNYSNLALEKKSNNGRMCGLDDFEMPEMTNRNEGENKTFVNEDVVVVSSTIGVHKDLDDIFDGSAIPVSETLTANSAQPSELITCDFPQVNKAPQDSPFTPDVREPTAVLPSPTITSTASVQEIEEVFLSDEEDEISPEKEYMASLEVHVAQLRSELLQQESQCQVLSTQNEEVSDKLHQHKTKSNLELNLLKKQIEELNEKLKSAESECTSVTALRESERKKFNSERSHMQEEVKNLQGRNASLELQKDRANDRIHELEQKLKNEMAAREQLNEETKNLQESLTSSSQRAHEAEVKYLGTKKDLVEQHLKGTMDRWNKEVARMRQLLVHANDNTIPERSTLSQSIMVWDAHIANLQVVISSFVEQGDKFLAMVNQGRPLNALPAGDLQAPPIQDINVADLLCLGQKTKVNMTGSGLLTNHSLGTSNNVDSSDRPSSPARVPKSAGRGAHHRESPTPGMDIHPAYNGTTANANNNASPVNGTRSKTSTVQTKNWPDSHQLFVGQLPWNYSEDDVKKFFTEQFGEVVSVTINDKGGNSEGNNGPKFGYVVFRKAEDRDKALNKKPIMINKHAINVQAKLPSNKHPIKSAGPPPGLAPQSHSSLAATRLSEAAGGRIPSPPAPIPLPVDPITITSNTKASTTASTTPTRAASSTLTRAASSTSTRATSSTSTRAAFSSAPSKISGKSLYSFTDISLNSSSESPKISGGTRSGAVATPTQSLSTTPTSTKPKLQNLTTNKAGTIGTPPKLFRPQPSRPGGGMTTTLNQSNTARGLSKSSASSAEESLMIGGSAYKKLIEVCKQRLGQEYAHSDILVALRDVRQRNNSTLSGLSLDVILERVRKQLRSLRPGSGGASVAPWAGLTAISGKSDRAESEWHGTEVLSPEDQCPICLEALASGPTVSLQCNHVFHESCIKDWLKRQSNCPNCRNFALMTDEYPSLS